MAVLGAPASRGSALQSLRGGDITSLPSPDSYAIAGGTPTEVAQAFQVILRDTGSVLKEVKETVSSVGLQLDKTNTFLQAVRHSGGMGTLGGNQQADLVNAFRDALSSVGLSGGRSGGGGVGVQEAPGLPYDQQGGQGPYGVSPASEGRVPSTSEMAPGLSGTSGRHGGEERMTAARQALGGFGMDHAGPRLDPFGLRGQIGGQGFDVGGIRQRVAGTLQRGLSGIHFGPELDQDEHGTYRWASGSGRGGRFASADEIDLFKKSQKIQGVIGAVGEKGLMGGIASEFPMLGGVLGGGAAVGGAIWAGSEIYGAQRQANMQFQRELGGSNLEAMRQRGNQQMFSLQQRFGVMGAGQANELYAGVVGIEEETRNGGFNRGAALNFGQHNASRFGMTAQQSIELINTASANGETSLSGLADALDRVTKSAREAGVNAEEARAKFTSYYQAAIQGGSGANAAAQAGNLASMQASLGPGFQSASFAGLVNGNPVNQIQQARSMGMGLVQYEQAVRDPRTGAATQASGETGQLAQITRGLLGQSGMSRVAAVTQSLGIGKGLKKESASDLTAADWLALENATGLEASTAQRALQSLMPGVQVSGDQALKAIAGVQAGIISPQAEQAARAQKSAVHEADAHDVARAQWGQNNPLKDRIGGTSGTPFSQETKVRHQNRQAYIKRVASSKMESPIVEALLKDQDFHRRFQVESDDGLRVVDLKTAMESYYDQIASGAAQIVAGTGSGGTIADYVANVGLAADPNASTELGGMNTAKTTGAGKDKKGNERIAPGQSAADWQKEQDKKGGSTTHVLIEATPELRRLFRITPGSAAAAVKSAGISGTTPPSSTDPGSRWGGWPVGP